MEGCAGAEVFGGVAALFAGFVVDGAAAVAGRLVDAVDPAVDLDAAAVADVDFDVFEFALDGARPPVGFRGVAGGFGLAGLFDVVKHLPLESLGDAGATELAVCARFRELLLGDVAERLGVVHIIRPGLGAVVEPALHPLFEDAVHKAAAVERGEFAGLFGLFDGVEAEDVGEEETVGAGGVAFERGCGEGALAVEGVPEVAWGLDHAVEFAEAVVVASTSGGIGALGGEAADLEQ